MRRILLPAVCLLAAVLAVPAFAESAAETRIPLHGRITGPGGDPLPGARASLVPVVSFHEYGRLVLEGRTNPEPVAGATAGADGLFHLAAPEPGMWKVLFEAKGFVPMELSLDPLLEEMDLPAVRLERDAGLQVKVTGPDGQPLAGARVRIEDVAPRFRRQTWQTPVRIVLADETGTAVLPRDSGETVSVRAGAPGYPSVEVKEVRGGTAAVRLLPGKTREIEVRDAAGKPVPGVIVRLGQGAWAVGRTSEDGLLSVAYTDGGERNLILTAEDGRWLEAFILPPGPKDKGPQKLRLAAPEMLSGKVVSAVDGRPLPGTLVWTSMDSGGIGKTGPSGEFRLSIVPDRPAMVSAAKAGFFQGQAEVGPRPGRPRRPPTLALEPALAASGRVVDERGQGIAGVEIQAEPQMVGRPSLSRIMSLSRSGGTLRTDASGRFRFSSLAAGTGHALRLTRQGFAPLRAEIPPLEPGRPVQDLKFVMHQGRTAFGRVLGPSETPVAGAQVTLRPAAPTDRMARIRQMRQTETGYEATTGKDGRFELADLPAGSFDLEARGRGYAPLTVPGLAVPEGKGSTDLGTVVLAPGVALEGYAVDPKGQPVAGAEVRASATQDEPFAASMREPGQAAAVTGVDGFFRIEDRRPSETLDLLITREGYAPGSAPGVRVPAEQPLRVTLQPASAILGKVVDPDGRPVPRAGVWATNMDAVGGMRIMFLRRPRPATTDEDGAFRLDGVAPGAAELHVTAEGWQPAELSNLEVPLGRDLKGVEVVLQPGATIEGRVLSPSGQPVPGAGVSVLQAGGATGRMMSFRSDATADGEGWYQVDGVAPGPHTLAAEHPSYRRTVRDLEVRMGENTLDLTLEGGNEVSGRVVDDGGVPVPGARIFLREGGRSFNLPEAASGADGAFEMAGVPDGDYRLSAEKEGFARIRDGEPVRVAGAPVAGVEVRLSRGGSIVGQISGLDLADLGRVRVAADFIGGYGKVTPEGAYRIDHLAPGEWHVSADVPGTSLHAEGRATLEPGASETRLDLEFGGGLTLTGRVLRNGAPVRGQSLTLQAPGSETRWGETDHDGRFRFGGLEKGSYELELMSFRSGLRHKETIEVSDDRDVLIELHTVAVTGRVVDAVDSSPINGAAVTLLPGAGAGDSFQPEVRTDSRGAFRIVDVPEGDWKVRAVADSYGPGEVDFAVTGAPVDDLRLALQATEGVTFEALLPSGRPPDQVRLVVLDPSGRTVTSGSYPVGENGRVRVSTVPAGTWEILLDCAGAAPVSVSITSPGNAGRIALPPAGGLRIQVPGLSGSRTAATVVFTGADGRPFRALEWGGEPKAAFELDGGTRRFERLPAGVWDVRVTAADGRTWTGKATVTPGTTAEVVLE